MTFLWDANFLIARTYPDHPHHTFARKWTLANPSFALCPITEGALVRYALRTSPDGAAIVTRSLATFARSPGYEFWPDDLSYGSMDLLRLSGHNQVTDAYLVALAEAHGGCLATFDRALATVNPKVVLVPTV